MKNKTIKNNKSNNKNILIFLIIIIDHDSTLSYVYYNDLFGILEVLDNQMYSFFIVM